MTITFRDFLDLMALQQCGIQQDKIINIETRQFSDIPKDYYRVWYWRD